jgi:lysophospholipase L1-like esterase
MKPLSFSRKPLLALLSAVTLAAGALAGDFFIRDGDRVVFLGDSITEQRLYTTYLEVYALARQPAWKLTFRNVGWGGDTSWLRQRSHTDEGELFAADSATQQRMVDEAVGRGLGRDVLPLKPTAVTVKFGMNDHSYQAFRPDIFGAYVRSQEQIAKVLQANGARVAFLTPQPIEDKRPDPDKDARNQSLRKFSDGLKAVAASTGSAFVDQFDPYMAMLLRERKDNPPVFIGGGDAVHPGPVGHTVMAWAILKGLDAPAFMSGAEIDGAAGKLLTAQGCRVENLKVSEGTISFDRLDETLPMPIDARAESALKLAPILGDLGRYELQVSGLPAGSYEVAIDGNAVAKLSSQDLAQGWNLTTTAGPITEQGRELLNLVIKKNDLFFNRWRNVQLYNFALPAWAQWPESEARRSAELARLDQQIAEQEARIDEVRRPKPHQFTVKRASQ